MATNADVQTIKNGAWEFMIGSTSIGLLADEEVNIEIDGNVVKSTANLTGKSTIKAWSGGTTAKITLTLLSHHKNTIRQIFSHILKNVAGNSTSASDGNAGRLSISSQAGECLRPIIVTGYYHHTLCETNQRFGSDATNPMSIQLTRAIVPEMINWAFSTEEALSQEITFEGTPDFNTTDNTLGYYGFNPLPTAIFAGIAFATLGAGLTVAPTIVFGTTFATGLTITVGQYLRTSNRLYRALNAGTSGATTPTHTTGSQTIDSIQYQYIGVAPSATISIANGQVVASTLNITDTGSNVPNDLPITFTAGVGSVPTGTIITY
jgi:hypothetical protein